MEKFDLIVIGAGPGGYVAAIRGAQLGLKTAIVEKEHLGGICLNWGCIPTKALLKSAELYQTIQHAEDFGISVKGLKFDFAKIVERSRAVSKQLAGGISHLLKKNKVTTIMGTASLKGAGALEVLASDGKKQALQASHIILATGARPRVLPGFEPDGHLIWTAKEAMMPAKLPESLLIIGSGAIGVEFASFYATFGTKITLVEMQDRILPVEDHDISALAQKALEKRKIEIYTNTVVQEIKKHKDTITAKFLHGGKTQTLETFDRIIMAVGIQGNVENLGLEKTKAKIEKGQILVNEFCETDEKGLYAIGDVAGAPWLAHKASHEGILCVEKIAGHKAHPLARANIPGCTYSTPQVASIGLTEHAAKEKGFSIKVGKFPYQANGKALAMGEPEGLIKTIFDAKTGELLGAHMIGAEVTELIQGFSIAKTLETTEAELMQAVFPHPTLSEMMQESVLSAYGKAIHY
jgi:dihydrolipoamide dehydrogenase